MNLKDEGKPTKEKRSSERRDWRNRAVQPFSARLELGSHSWGPWEWSRLGDSVHFLLEIVTLPLQQGFRSLELKRKGAKQNPAFPAVGPGLLQAVTAQLNSPKRLVINWFLNLEFVLEQKACGGREHVNTVHKTPASTGKSSVHLSGGESVRFH